MVHYSCPDRGEESTRTRAGIGGTQTGSDTASLELRWLYQEGADFNWGSGVSCVVRAGGQEIVSWLRAAPGASTTKVRLLL